MSKTFTNQEIFGKQRLHEDGTSEGARKGWESRKGAVPGTLSPQRSREAGRRLSKSVTAERHQFAARERMLGNPARMSRGAVDMVNKSMVRSRKYQDRLSRIINKHRIA